MVRLTHIARFVVRPIGSSTWDWVLWVTGGVALVATVVHALVPTAGELVVFCTMMFLTSGPVSTFLPAASEPIIMAFAQLYPPATLAGTGTAAILGIECVNYPLFRTVLHSRALQAVRSAKATRLVTRWYRVWPFGTIAFCAFSPAPFWLARCCAALDRYPVARFLAATAVGRLPRIWVIALAGTALPFTPSQILAGGLVVIVGFACLGLAQRRRPRLVHAPT